MAIYGLGDTGDVRLFIGDQQIGEVQTITVNREYTPIYGMGNTTTPYQVFEGPRKLSGTITFKNGSIIKPYENFHGDSIDKLFKSVRMKKDLQNEDYTALLNKGELF